MPNTPNHARGADTSIAESRARFEEGAMNLTPPTPAQTRRRRIVATALILVALTAAAYRLTWGNERFRCEHSGGSWTKTGEHEITLPGGSAPMPEYGCVTRSRDAQNH